MMVLRKWIAALGIRRWLLLLAALGLVMHGGTALLRLGVFYPVPRILDFSAFYTGASALRMGRSPYALDGAWVEALRETRNMTVSPPLAYNPPVWLWLLQPLTFLSFPAAAWVWLGLNLLALGWSALMLRDLAGYRGWLGWVVVFGLTVTFGPVSLDLTLGQTSVTLLTAALIAGCSLSSPSSLGHDILGAVAQGAATGAKLFPLGWVGALGVMRRWRALVLSVWVALLFLGGGYFLLSNSAAQDWQQVLVRRVTSASDRVSMDDQSLSAWLLRLTQSQQYQVPGLRVWEGKRVTWSPPWDVSASRVKALGYVVAGLLLIPVLLALVRVTRQRHEPGYYLWILYPLVVLPHIARYNHTLLLPAIAWLWGREGRAREWAVLAYGLVGLSRLNHLWLRILPWPLAPLASGAGLYAVFVLGFGLIKALGSEVHSMTGCAR